MSSKNNQYNTNVGLLVTAGCYSAKYSTLVVGIIIVPCYNCGFIKEVQPESYEKG